MGNGRGGWSNCDADADPREPMDHHGVANLANEAGKAFISKRDARRLALSWFGDLHWERSGCKSRRPAHLTLVRSHGAGL